MPRWRAAILLLYGIANAAAYSCLLPLWEGFDEAYHYGYVQSLSTKVRFPALGSAFLSQEIWRSLELVPVSRYLQPFTRAPVNFTEYFALPEEERANRRRQLDLLSPSAKYQPQTGKPNYEVNQSPAAYLWMAAVDRALSSFALTTRVLALRLLSSVLAVALTAHAMLLVARRLALPDGYYRAALFCVFSSQMFYATVCHISNDSLAVPLMTYFIWAAIRAGEAGGNRAFSLVGLALALALLTKAYYLCLIPVAAGVMVWAWRRGRAELRAAAFVAGPAVLLAGPWYIRNLILYRNLTGTVESTSGLGPTQLVAGAASLPWLRAIASMAHGSIWTGNNSFTTFSSTTLNGILLLLAAALLLWLGRARRKFAELVIAAAIVCFSLELALISVAFFISTKGAAIAAVPWYMQPLLPPVLLLAFLGISRAGRWSRLLLSTTTLLWGYVLAATYVVKLVPFYSGFPQAHAHVRELLVWYQDTGAHRDSILRTLGLVSPELLWTLIAVAIALAASLWGWLALGGGAPAPSEAGAAPASQD